MLLGQRRRERQLAARTRQRAVTDSAHDAYLATRHFGALDGLRCFSIVPVVWHHCTPRPLPGLLGKGPAGVDLFFCISGFLITTLLLREKSRTGQIALHGFYVRRALRILPLYYAVLLSYVAFAALLPRSARTFFTPCRITRPSPPIGSQISASASRSYLRSPGRCASKSNFTPFGRAPCAGCPTVARSCACFPCSPVTPRRSGACAVRCSPLAVWRCASSRASPRRSVSAQSSRSHSIRGTASSRSPACSV